MTITLDDLREVLAARAATTSFDDAAARARLDARLAGRPSGTRRTRPLLVAAVAALVLGVVSAAVVGVLHRQPATGPATAPASALPLADWLFTVRTDALPADLDVVQYGHADRSRQVAVVLRPGDAATSNTITAFVELDVDPATRPDDAAPDDGGGWSSPTSTAEWGVGGWQVVWTDPAGYTVRAVAPDLATARTLRAATEVGATHPTRFPMAVATGALPAGSRVQSVEFTGTQGIDAVVSVPGTAPWTVSVAAPGVYLDDVRGSGAPVTSTPLAVGFSRVTGADLEPSSAVLTSASVDIRIIKGAPGDPERPTVTDADLTALVTGARFAPFALHPDQQAWFPLAEALPAG